MIKKIQKDKIQNPVKPLKQKIPGPNDFSNKSQKTFREHLK